jgi:hypothetical protein
LLLSLFSDKIRFCSRCRSDFRAEFKAAHPDEKGVSAVRSVHPHVLLGFFMCCVVTPYVCVVVRCRLARQQGRSGGP